MRLEATPKLELCHDYELFFILNSLSCTVSSVFTDLIFLEFLVSHGVFLFLIRNIYWPSSKFSADFQVDVKVCAEILIWNIFHTYLKFNSGSGKQGFEIL